MPTVLKSWKPQPPEALGAHLGEYRESFTFTCSLEFCNTSGAETSKLFSFCHRKERQLLFADVKTHFRARMKRVRVESISVQNVGYVCTVHCLTTLHNYTSYVTECDGLTNMDANIRNLQVQEMQ